MGGGAEEIGGGVVSAAGTLGGDGTTTGPPEGGARLTAAPGSGTAAGGTGGGRSLNHCASAGPATSGSTSASAGHSRTRRRNPEMPSPQDVIVLLFTENAANSSLVVLRTAAKPARFGPKRRSKSLKIARPRSSHIPRLAKGWQPKAPSKGQAGTRGRHKRCFGLVMAGFD